MIGVSTVKNKIWRTGGWPTYGLAHYYTPKNTLQLCQNCKSVNLINHPSKVMLKVILIRLKPKAEKIIAEEQAGFRARRSTMVKSSTSESCVKSNPNIRRIFTMSSLISRKPSKGYGMQPYGLPCGSIILMQI